jgi:hypothetical protein
MRNYEGAFSFSVFSFLQKVLLACFESFRNFKVSLFYEVEPLSPFSFLINDISVSELFFN